jgi:hypothetical protein
MPPWPTAQTSLGPLPQTLLMRLVVPLGTLDHAEPVQCKIVPEEPTAQTSLDELPQTARSSFPVPLVVGATATPFQ